MDRQLKAESIIQILFYVLGIFILLNILFPIIKPASIAAGADIGQTTFYERILGSSIPAMKVVQASDDDESRTGTFSIIFKYLTNIDITNPKSYLASQIPLLQYVEMTSVVSNDPGPYIEVIPKDEELIPENTHGSNNPENPGANEPSKQPIPNTDNTSPEPPAKIDQGKPVVLIYHTHTRETYNPLGVKDQNHSYDFNTGVCKVGEELKRELESKYGISVIHDTTAHDVPTQDGGYTRSRKTLEKNLKKYPSLKLIIDLHRDSALRNVATAKINNVYYSRVMFVIASGNKKKAGSIGAANKYNSKFNELYPGFSRGLYYSGKYAVYNQDLSPNILILEIGGIENSLDESMRSAKLTARVISEVLKK